MNLDVRLPPECVKMLFIAKELEDIAFSLAGQIDKDLVSQMILASVEICRIEKKVHKKIKGKSRPIIEVPPSKICGNQK